MVYTVFSHPFLPMWCPTVHCIAHKSLLCNVIILSVGGHWNSISRGNDVVEELCHKGKNIAGAGLHWSLTYAKLSHVFGSPLRNNAAKIWAKYFCDFFPHLCLWLLRGALVFLSTRRNKALYSSATIASHIGLCQKRDLQIFDHHKSGGISLKYSWYEWK